MRDLAMQWFVAFSEWGADSPFYAAVVCAVIVTGPLAFLWIAYDWLMPKFRVWRFRR